MQQGAPLPPSEAAPRCPAPAPPRPQPGLSSSHRGHATPTSTSSPPCSTTSCHAPRLVTGRESCVQMSHVDILYRECIDYGNIVSLLTHCLRRYKFVFLNLLLQGFALALPFNLLVVSGTFFKVTCSLHCVSTDLLTSGLPSTCSPLSPAWPPPAPRRPPGTPRCPPCSSPRPRCCCWPPSPPPSSQSGINIQQ